MSQTNLPAHPYDPRSTSEQVVIYDWVENGTGNLIIRARAGSGKTTTLVEICKLLPPNQSTTFLAFNVHIKKELKLKLPSNVFCYTTHGLGYAAIKKKYKNVIVDNYKVDKLIVKYLKIWNVSDVENLYLYGKDLKKAISLVRLSLTLNKKYVLDLCERHEIKFDHQDVDRIFIILEEMLKDKKTIDYTDMVYLPCVDNKIWLFPQEFILVDEAQDLGRAQHELIKKAIKKDKSGTITGRLIFVGDDMQAIYGFAGADTFSFANLMKIPNTIMLPLTTTFRCAKNIVKEANTIVTDIKPMDDAPDGVVRVGSAVDEAVSGDFILSRKTYPLIKMFFELLVQNKKAFINGSDVGETLINFTEGKNSMGQLDAGLTNRLNEYKDNLRSQGILHPEDDLGFIALRDNVKIIRFLMPMCEDITDIKNRINYIFRDKEDEDNGIILSTVHKAKGLEANRVFIIHPKDMPLRTGSPAQYMQELNLKYIAITRAKNELVYDNEWTSDDEEFQMFENPNP